MTAIGSRAPSGASGRRGFTLLEMTIVLCIAALLLAAAVMGLRYLSDRNTTANLAYGLKLIYRGAHAYVTRNYSELSRSGEPEIQGFENPMRPTVDELKAAHFLGHSDASEGYTGGHWQVRIEQANPEHCPGTACNLNLLVFLDRPVMREGRPALDLAADAAHQAHVPAGFSGLPPHQTALTGIQRSWSVPNPVPDTPPAVLGALGEFAASGFSIHLPRSGALPMQGDLKMTDERGQAHSITGVKNLQLSGDLSAKGNILSDGTIHAEQNLTTNGSLQLAGDVMAGGVIIPGDPGADAGDACEFPGAIARGIAGKILICSALKNRPRASAWAPVELAPARGTLCGMGRVTGKAFANHNFTDYADCKGHNPAESCPVGYERVHFYDGTVWTDIYVCTAE